MYHQLAVWCRNRPQPNARRLDRSDSRKIGWLQGALDLEVAPHRSRDEARPLM